MHSFIVTRLGHAIGTVRLTTSLNCDAVMYFRNDTFCRIARCRSRVWPSSTPLVMYKRVLTMSGRREWDVCVWRGGVRQCRYCLSISTCALASHLASSAWPWQPVAAHHAPSMPIFLHHVQMIRLYSTLDTRARADRIYTHSPAQCRYQSAAMHSILFSTHRVAVGSSESSFGSLLAARLSSSSA